MFISRWRMNGNRWLMGHMLRHAVMPSSTQRLLESRNAMRRIAATMVSAATHQVSLDTPRTHENRELTAASSGRSEPGVAAWFDIRENLPNCKLLRGDFFRCEADIGVRPCLGESILNLRRILRLALGPQALREAKQRAWIIRIAFQIG